MTSPAPSVLYIDDDEGLCHLVSRFLTRRGFRVETAADGLDGAARAAAGSFDVIAVDHYMPRQDGLETLAQIRRMEDPTPVVYVTGSDESRLAIAALKAGAADYVVKTIGEEFFDLLATALLQAVERRQLQRGKEEAEAALHATNARLQALLKEVNHRVANSLQMVSAFVQMQSSGATDDATRRALTSTQRRIAAIAQVHRKLYTSDDVETVDMVDYLSALVGELEETWSTPESPRQLTLVAEPVRLKTDQAVSVGVIVNELVSNACKYAYADNGFGEVRIRLQRRDDAFLLEVEDDGSGFSSRNPAQGTGLGTKLIRAMVSSLRAELVYEHRPVGFCASLRAAL